MPADDTTTPAAAPVAPVLRSLGLFSRWELVGPPGTTDVVVVPPPPSTSAAPASDTDEGRRETTRRHAVYVRDFARGQLLLPLQVKGLRIERSEGATVTLARGAVATVEAHRCRRLVLRLLAPVAALVVDDCDDVTVELSWGARLGYCNEERPGDTDSQAGFHVFSTGSHSVRVAYPLSADADAPMAERVLPETLHTRFHAATDEPRTAVVDRSRPWGDTPAGRPVAAQAPAALGAAAAGVAARAGDGQALGSDDARGARGDSATDGAASPQGSHAAPPVVEQGCLSATLVTLDPS